MHEHGQQTAVDAPRCARVPLRVERVDSAAALRALAADWQRVQDACASQHVLLDHRWACAWWDHFGVGKELHALVFRRGDRVVGVAPMMLSRGLEAYPARDTMVQIADDFRHVPSLRWRQFVPVRRVGFLLNVPSHNMRAHFLLEQEDDRECYAAAMAYWAQRSSMWDVLCLEGLPTSSPQPDLAQQAAAEQGLRVLPHGAVREVAVAELGGTLQDFMQSRSRHFRKRIKYEIRLTQAAGDVTFASYRGDRIAEGLQVLFALERASWKANGDPRRFVQLSLDDRTRAFFTDVSEAFAATDGAEVLVMLVDRQPAAALLSWARGRRVLCMVTYMAEAWRERITSAPLFHRFLEAAIERRATTIDIHGNTVHARKWSNALACHRRLHVFNRHPYSRLLGASKHLATSVSRMLRRREQQSEPCPD